MSEVEKQELEAVELGEQATEQVSEPANPAPDTTPQTSFVRQSEPGTQAPESEEKTSEPPQAATAKGGRWTQTVEQFKLRKFFVLRPGTLDQAIEDIKALVNKEEDGAVLSVWLLAEVDHWNNEKERLVFITENYLFICKYDFVMLNCEQIQKVPLNIVDRVSHGAFSFPPRSLLKREGDGVRVFWDRLREPSFTSKWNPFAVDYPFATFTYHPVCNANDSLRKMCDINGFREQLTEAATKAHLRKPIPGKANGVLVLNQPLLIEAYVGLMSLLGNQNKLGYCMARGSVGF
ncbi:tumor protein p63-regulated gene 1 protein [Chanos chanos]|uniref:Tumor protein p63-regulated gene 1 protein n=1 Tax=Chanos chanos TaxID=29144 RepID=A0A6J2WU60_CHACN|nr:tumor protein p63-regulated gene 1-like protein [Chanos chanos]